MSNETHFNFFLYKDYYYHSTIVKLNFMIKMLTVSTQTVLNLIIDVVKSWNDKSDLKYNKNQLKHDKSFQ